MSADPGFAEAVSAAVTFGLAILIVAGIEGAISWLAGTPFDRLDAMLYLVGVLYVDARMRAWEARDER